MERTLCHIAKNLLNIGGKIVVATDLYMLKSLKEA